jgi:hypothetical protein
VFSGRICPAPGGLDLQQDRATLELCRVAYSNLTRICSWGPEGVVLAPSEALAEDDAAAIRAVRSQEKTRIWQEEEIPVTERDVRIMVKLHPKVSALAQLHELFRRGTPPADIVQVMDQILQVAQRYVPTED